jgi:hypothetical protein
MSGKLGRVRLLIVGLGVVVAVAGCSKRPGTDESRPRMSERSRDSILAKSRIPGAGAVGRALAATDSAAARAARIDSLTR